jgi:hypothetical protein
MWCCGAIEEREVDAHDSPGEEKKMRRRELMNRWIVGATLLLVIALGGIADRVVSSCSEWQERYKRFRYVSMMKNVPVIYSLEDIERIIGDRPRSCEAPTLTDDDLARLRAERVDLNEFDEDQR